MAPRTIQEYKSELLRLGVALPSSKARLADYKALYDASHKPSPAKVVRRTSSPPPPRGQNGGTPQPLSDRKPTNAPLSATSAKASSYCIWWTVGAVLVAVLAMSQAGIKSPVVWPEGGAAKVYETMNPEKLVALCGKGFSKAKEGIYEAMNIAAYANKATEEAAAAKAAEEMAKAKAAKAKAAEEEAAAKAKAKATEAAAAAKAVAAEEAAAAAATEEVPAEEEATEELTPETKEAAKETAEEAPATASSPPKKKKKKKKATPAA